MVKKGPYHATVNYDHDNVFHNQQSLDQAYWDGEMSVLILLYVSKEKCQNVYAPSDSSINNIYDRNASCHF